MQKKQLIELMNALGFKETSSKNVYMLSFFKEETNDNPRVNIYFTTMTVQIQWRDGRAEVHKGVDSGELEDLLNKI